MLNRKKEPDRAVEIQISRLRVAPWYKDLVVFERDCTSLRGSFAEHGFKCEYPVVVRQLDQRKEYFEIVCGYQRVKVAAEFHLERIYGVVKDLDEEGARRYALEDNLSPARIFAPISPVQAIVLSRDLEKRGGKYRVGKILELTGIEKSTYKRVVASLNYALSLLRDRYSELSGLDEPGLIAESIRRNLWPEFNDFCNGKMPPFTFYHTFYLPSETSKRRSEKQRVYRGLPEKQASSDISNLIAIAPVELPPSPNCAAALRGILQLACQASQGFGSNESMRPLSQEQLEILTSFAREREKIAPVLETILEYYNQSRGKESPLSRSGLSLSSVKLPARRRAKHPAEVPPLLPLFPHEDNR